jgi:hypothetical protein
MFIHHDSNIRPHESDDNVQLSLLYITPSYSYRGNQISSNIFKWMIQFGSHYIFSESDIQTLEQFSSLYICQMINSFFGYGIAPAFISTVCGRFNDRTVSLLLSTSIASSIDPLFRGLTYWIRMHSELSFALASCVLTTTACAELLLLTLPSDARLFKEAGLLPVALYVSFNALHVFTNTCVFRALKDRSRGYQRVPTDAQIALEKRSVIKEKVFVDGEDAVGRLRRVDHNESLHLEEEEEEEEEEVNRRFRLGGVVSQTGALLGTLVASIVLFSGAVGQ